MLVHWSATPGHCRRYTSMTGCSTRERRNEQPDGAVAGSHDQSPLQNLAHADDRLAVRHAGRTSDPGKEKPHRVPGGVAAGRGGRTRTEHHRAPNPRSASTAYEDAGGVRLYAVAECERGEDTRPGRRRLH